MTDRISVLPLHLFIRELAIGWAENIRPKHRHCGLRAGTGHKAADLCVAVAVVIGPHNGRAEAVGLSYNGRVRYYQPLSMNSHAIMAFLCVPIDILHTDTIGESAAQSVSARKAIEPFLEWRIGKAAVVTRVEMVWNEHNDAQYDERHGELVNRGRHSIDNRQVPIRSHFGLASGHP